MGDTMMPERVRMLPLTSCLLALATGVSLPVGSVSAAPLQPAAIQQGATGPSDLIEVRAAVRRGGAAMGPRGGAVVHRGGAVVGPRGAAYRGRAAVIGPRGNVAVRSTTAVAGRGAWARPGYYHWPRGGAIAAGAAIGFVTAATAVAWAGAAPAPGMCWYYTDPSRTQGFWDYCQ
ncbi:hypothetical protein G6321_00024765 [Bradyrhizobium barranii subsp. barranii]|uniref:Uncharacterized protein n=2 Tax=Bradyrhizobium barranii subsp. barranii TaxID=2823807 RepID=A0A9X9Z4Q5_9BRAD|nr:hypothetical protein [Bradyrhizobium barranii]UGX98160.1 hypothetical protein G6321_00024765 [Bradyrhizobium barranii subsp. barranii]